jgi:hypothetical protein
LGIRHRKQPEVKMGLLTVLRKLRQKEREIRVLMLCAEYIFVIATVFLFSLEEC